MTRATTGLPVRLALAVVFLLVLVGVLAGAVQAGFLAYTAGVFVALAQLTIP